MKAAFDFDRHYFVAVRPKYVAQLGDTFSIRALRQTHEYRPINTHHVTAIQSRGLEKEFKRPVTRERIGQTMRFGPPARRSHVEDDCNFVYHHRRIFNKNSIWQCRFCGKRNDANTQFGEAILIRAVLRNCFRNIDRLPRMK